MILVLPMRDNFSPFLTNITPLLPSPASSLPPSHNKVWEMPYDVMNASFLCSIDRICGTLPPSDQMYLINHNPDFSEGSLLSSGLVDASTTNGVSLCVDSPSLPILLGRVTQTIYCFSVW